MVVMVLENNMVVFSWDISFGIREVKLGLGGGSGERGGV